MANDDGEHVSGGATMKVTLVRTGAVALEARNERGEVVRIAGSSELEARVMERLSEDAVFDPPAEERAIGEGPDLARGGFRPMELFLVSLASCSALDVIAILTRQREPLSVLRIEVEGKRADATPAVFTDIEVRFIVPGAVDRQKLERAVALSVDKYCSVRAMLGPGVTVRHRAETLSEEP